MQEEIKEILDKFDKVLENYELDKKWGQMSVDSICHLFPNEMIIIKDYITNLQEEYEKEHYLVDKLTRQLNDEYKNTEYQCKQKEDYKSKCEKAIEYINSKHNWYGDEEEDNEDYLFELEDFEELLNILQGKEN